MMTDDQILEVVQAHKEGKKIECRRKRETDWYHLAGDPVWNFDDYDFRVAPELRKPKDFWILDRDEFVIGCRSPGETQSRYLEYDPNKLIHVREVLE